MSKVLRAAFSPTKLIIAAAIIVAVGVATGHILPRVNAAECESEQCPVTAIDCSEGQVIQNNECVDPTCLTKDGEFFVPVPIPQGQHANSDGYCTPDDPTPQVLGESTTVSDPTPAPQVLAETFGK